MQKLFSDNRKLSQVFFVMAFAPLAAALISQYGFGMKPCELCIFQRIPYFVILIFSMLAIIRPSMKIFLISAVIIIHAFFIDSGIAFYHVGVEKHWWVHGNCSSTLNMSSFEALKTSIMATPAVRCDDVQFEFLGVSMAGWNFIYALLAAIFSIYIMVRYFKQKAKDVTHVSE